MGWPAPEPPKSTLTLDMSFPERPAVPELPPPIMPELKDDGPYLALERFPPVKPAETDERRGPRRLRWAAMLVTTALVLVAAGFGMNEWDLRRQELAQPLTLPTLPTPPAQPVNAGAAPVVPPAEFFAPVIR